MSVSIRGIQEAEAAMLKVIAAVNPQGGLGRAIQFAAVQAHRYATYITHYVTGALKSSHRIDFQADASSARAQIYIDPSGVNPLGEKPAEYGIEEHDRGGSHAFYKRTVDEQGDQIRDRAMAYVRGLF